MRITVPLAVCTALVTAVLVAHAADVTPAEVVAPPAAAKPAATKVLTVADIVEKEGRFVFSDGSSFYVFKKDGTFKSGPLGMSGRTIDGIWKLADGVWQSNDFAFDIQGIWAGVNQLSAPNDRRKMILYVSPRETFKTVRNLGFIAEPGDSKVYDCYFEIEELAKLPQESVAATPK